MTKRQSCGILASLYDPLGLLIEHDMHARSIWRDINKSTPTDWEAIIPVPLVKAARDWAALSDALSKSRPSSRHALLDQPLVLSTDASANAWGADLRSLGDLSVRVAGRGGLFNSSNLSWSIPRKELDALHRGLLWVPLNVLFPRCPDQPLTVVVDSEVTVYRLKRPSNDAKLPAPEQRRLAAVRGLCLELRAHIKHVASNCNPSDSISRCNLSDDEKEELRLLLEFVDTTRGITDSSESTLDNIEFQRRLTVCARRCQSNDTDLSKFRDYLEGKTAVGSLGLRKT
ncbi:hypothetical protein FOZ63_008613, partial [Perkinsus olseni]